MSKKVQKEMLRGPRDSTRKRDEDGTTAKHRPSLPFAPGEAAASAPRRCSPGQPTSRSSPRQSPTRVRRGERATASRSDYTGRWDTGEEACNNNNNKTPRDHTLLRKHQNSEPGCLLSSPNAFLKLDL